MATIRSDTACTSESMLSRIDHIGDLTKEKEEELLYEGGEDGDEEDALSDDSIRLRLSDDEEVEEPVIIETISIGQKNENSTADTATVSASATDTHASSNNSQQKTPESSRKNSVEQENEKDAILDISSSASKEEKREDSKVHEIGDDTSEKKSPKQSLLALELLKKPSNNVEITKNLQVSSIQASESTDELACHETIDKIKEEENVEKFGRKIKEKDEEVPKLSNTSGKHSKSDSCKNSVPKTNGVSTDDESAKKTSKKEKEEELSDDPDDLVCVKDTSAEREQALNNIFESSIGDTGNTLSPTQNDLRGHIEPITLVSLLSKPLPEREKIALQRDKQESGVTVNGTNNNSLTDSDSVERRNSDGGPTRKKKKIAVSEPKVRKSATAVHEALIEEETQVRESGRQRRKTAKDAEEIIRKRFLSTDSDAESSDGSDKFVIVNHRSNHSVRSLSPPSLKRTLSDPDTATVNGNLKKIKTASKNSDNDVVVKDENKIKHLNYVHQFFRRDLKEKLPKLKQEELEELLIQKIVETITMHSEIGKLREQARISEKNQEAMRTRCQQLAKQIKDFEMVLSRNAADRRANNDKPTAPIKINRSVGLQVNFLTEHGIQNLRQLQQNSTRSHTPTNSNNSPSVETNNNAISPRCGIKIRSPRKSDVHSNVQTVTVSQNHVQTTPILSTVTPAALVVAKPMESQHPSLHGQSGLQQIVSNAQQTQPQAAQAIVLNGKLPNKINRHSTGSNASKAKPSDLIDLTDEEEKSKATVNVPTVTAQVVDPQLNVPKTQQCFQRVIQAIPGNVTIAGNSTSIRVVQPASRPTPTALVNNMNARLAYVMQSGVNSTRQLLISSNSNPIRPVTSCNRASFSTLTYKTGTSIANGTVRVLTTSATGNVQVNKHPAPLPDTPGYVTNPILKLPPPAPSLKISKVANGIVLSWNMTLTERYADIASYQLYAYQEIVGAPPSTGLWKKVGDVRALPLPMACTLTQFSEGNNYYFAVRAVDTHSRKGPYSMPGNISL